jgi:hypothetical protein
VNCFPFIDAEILARLSADSGAPLRPFTAAEIFMRASAVCLRPFDAAAIFLLCSALMVRFGFVSALVAPSFHFRSEIAAWILSCANLRFSDQGLPFSAADIAARTSADRDGTRLPS